MITLFQLHGATLEAVNTADNVCEIN